jgi:D-sedoheptulose 7-phosphate isomerase
VNRDKFISDSLLESAEIKRKILNSCTGDILKAVDILTDAFRANKKLLLCGNGGSAADAQHIATELVVRLSHDFERPAIPAIALTTDSSNLTAGGNDIGFENTFARSVEALGNEGDVLIGISTSGNSENVLRAIKKAKEKGLRVVGLLGNHGGRIKDFCDVSIVVPSKDTGRIQEGHITIAHIICGLVELELFGQNV